MVFYPNLKTVASDLTFSGSGNIVPLNRKSAGNQNDFSSLYLFVFLNVWKQGRFGKVCSPRIHLSLTN